MVTVVGVGERASSMVLDVYFRLWMMKTWIKISVAEKERDGFEVGKGRSGDLNDVAFERESSMTPRLRACEL